MKPIQVSDTMVIELHVFNNKKKKKKYMYIEHGQNMKIQFSITLDMWHFHLIFGVNLCFNMLCDAKMLKVKFT